VIPTLREIEMTYSALVIGEALIDVVHPVHGPITETPGGSPMNVAIALSRLGVRTDLVTALGDDVRADMIENHLAASGVNLAPGARRLAATSTAEANLREDGSADYQFHLAWDPPAVSPRAADVVHTGSIALFLSPGRKTVQDALRRSAPHSLISIDPNIRPPLLANRAAARTKFHLAASVAHVIKLSDDDAAWLYPRASDRDVLRTLLALGPSLVVLTKGAAGAVMATDGRVIDIDAPLVTVADTIGAGDAFMGALLHQLMALGVTEDLKAGRPLWPEEIATVGDFAAKAAAHTVARRGADPPSLMEMTP
jgi:fructokinase